jgi:UDP-N-acetylmuramoylalanine--D-glutamate ligase
VFLNIAPDHLDRHPDPGSYLAAKLRIFANQENEDVAVYNGDEPALAGHDLGGCGRRVAFCSESAGPDCAVELRDGVIHRGGDALAEAGELPLAGAHNIANAMAAAAAALAMGIAADPVRDGLLSFSPLPHRLERVAESGGVLYVNDSKATNVAAAAAGIRSFPGGVHAILGGQPKGESFSGLLSPLRERCVACYLIGVAESRLAEELQPLADDLDIRACGDLERAVRETAAAAEPGQVVLLSPACASFDAYPDFEVRGEHFRSLVEALA